MVAVGSEHPCIDLYSTMSGSLLARLEGHTKRSEQFCVGMVYLKKTYMQFN